METEYTFLERLGRPFAVSQLRWRKGGGNLNLVYITSRDVMRRLDEVCGTDWQCRYSHVTDSGLTCCEIGIKVDGEWIFRASGAGETSIEGSKGTFTDAFKRAAVRWGVARYLYSLGATWVRLQKRGNSHIIDPSEMGRLKDLVRFGYGGEIARGSDEALNWATEMLERLSECSDLDDVNNLAADNQTEFGRWFKKEPNIANDVKREIDKRRKELE